MKALNVLVGVTCVVVSVCGALYIKEKFDDERRLRELTQHDPVSSGMERVDEETSDSKVIGAEFGPRYD